MTTDRPEGDKLAESFPPEQLKRHPSKGLSYIPIPEVIARLNRVLGAGNWNSEIRKIWESGSLQTQTGTYPKWVMAHVALTGTVDGVPFHFEGVGGQEVQFIGGSDPKGPVDIGDSYKGAVSDATKKAAQSLGVGLELAREDDAMHYEQAAKEADQPKAAPAALERIKELGEALSSDNRKIFNHWWADLTGDGVRGKKVGAGQVTVREAAEAIQFLEDFSRDESSEPTDQ